MLNGTNNRSGANGGIGLEAVLAIAQESERFHVLLGCRSLEKGEKALAELKSSHGDSIKGSISVIQIDIIDDKTVQAAKSAIENEYGRLDVLINNAGIIVYKPCDTLTNLRETFETNVFGTTLVTEAFEPLLRKSSNPYLIHVSSNQGSITQRLDSSLPHYQVRGDFYRASKAALNMIAACHKVNFAEWGCKVCSFNPGLCVTNLTGEAGRAMRIKFGARDARDPGVALAKIVLGERDEDMAKSGIVDLDGGVLPW